MPRFIVERTDERTASHHNDYQTVLARTFSMGGKTFDVYIAGDRAAFRRFAGARGIAASRIYG